MPIQLNPGTAPSFAPEGTAASPNQGGSAPGRLQGRDVEHLSAAQTVTPMEGQPLGEARERPSLQQRNPVQQAPQFELLRQARLSGLDSADAFTAKAGAPRKDLSFSFLGKHRRDEGYKAVLSGMKTYEEQAASVGLSRVVAREGLRTMTTMLSDLSAGVDRYQAQDLSRGGARKEAFGKLAHQIANEKRAIDDVAGQLERGDHLPPGASLADAVAFAREGVSLKDMGTLMERGLSAFQAKEGREFIDNQRAISALQDRARMTAYEEKGLDEGDAFLLESAGHGAEVGAMYKDMRVPITHQTIVNGLVEDQLQSPLKVLGQGGFNSVSAGKFNTPDGVYDAAFKPLQKTEKGWVAYKTGISRDDPQIVMRNLATGDVARHLGFDVVVKTQLGLCRPPPGKNQPAPAAMPMQLGMVMRAAQGKPAKEIGSSAFYRADVQREVTKLQLLDHLVGQGDRHGGNYFIHIPPVGEARVFGIDNDQCFGQLLTDPNGIRNKTDDDNFVNSYGMKDQAGKERPRYDLYETRADGVQVLKKKGWNHDGFRGTNMPPVIDRSMALALRNLTPSTLSKLLGKKLLPAEVAATEVRLAAMKKHIDRLEAQGRIIGPDDWGRDVANFLALGDASNSYLARDCQRAERKEQAALFPALFGSA